MGTESRVLQRRYISANEAHYAGGLVDGGYLMRLFGEAATEMSVITSSDEGLLAGYKDVNFLAPVFVGDIIEVRAEIVSKGNRSRLISFEAYVTARSEKTEVTTKSAPVVPKLLVAKAMGTLVVPAV